ncbi:hypothetical protein ACQ86N_27965 [Puia sp. P3]|uniref:hypothetical protein n=1 Tax=Puia sp. P3 TaxID=3423952 RepID=UPI003D6779A0
MVGGNDKASAFIDRVKTAMQPDNQYYTLLEQYEKGRHDTVFLRKMSMAAVDAFDKPTSGSAASDYLRQQKDLLSAPNLHFIDNTTASSADIGFAVLRKHPARLEQAQPPQESQRQLHGYLCGHPLQTRPQRRSHRRRTKSIDLGSEEEKIAFRQTLEKCKKEKKTWD